MDDEDKQLLREVHTAIVGPVDGSKPGILTRIDRLEQHQRYLGLAIAPGLGLFLAWVKQKLGQ